MRKAWLLCILWKNISKTNKNVLLKKLKNDRLNLT